jgi:hypothetical protein
VQAIPRSVVLAAVVGTCLLASDQAHTSGAAAVEPRVTLKIENRSIQRAIAIIREKSGVGITMNAGLDTAVTIGLKDVAWRTALGLVVEKAGYVAIDHGGRGFTIERPPAVYQSRLGIPIHQVIDDIARRSGAKILVDPEVVGAVCPPRRGTTWRDALESVCTTLGYEVVEESRGVLRVVPRNNLREDLVTKVFRLRFVLPRSWQQLFTDYNIRDVALWTRSEALDLLSGLRQILTPNLGTVEYIERTNSLVVKDIKSVIDEVKSIMELTDADPSLALVNGRFVMALRGDVGWGSGVGGGEIPMRNGFDLGSGGFDEDRVAVREADGPCHVVFRSLSFQRVEEVLWQMRAQQAVEDSRRAIFGER